MNEYRQQVENSRNESAADKEGLEKKMRDVAEKAKMDNDAAAARYEQQMVAYREQLDSSRNTSAAEKAQMAQLVSDMQRRNEEERRAFERRSRGGGFFGVIGRAIVSIFGI